MAIALQFHDTHVVFGVSPFTIRAIALSIVHFHRIPSAQ